jgi:hypothetical protein
LNVETVSFEEKAKLGADGGVVVPLGPLASRIVGARWVRRGKDESSTSG